MWDRISNLLQAAHGKTLGALLDSLATAKTRRNEASFSIALIALSAKMAKADGIVTDDEVEAFRSFFEFPMEESRNVKMIYELAQQDVAGFDHYAKQVGRLFKEQPVILEDVLDCLYHVALADGVAHPSELTMLDEAAQHFGISELCRRRIRAAHMGADKNDPFTILGVSPETTEKELLTVFRRLAKQHHPDALIARGVPSSLVKIAEGRMAAINEAYESARQILSGSTSTV